MLRQILQPSSNKFTIQLPDEMVGKTIELLAFEIEDSESVSKTSSASERLKNIQSIFSDCRVDLSGFKFSRDEANNYGAS